MQINSDLHCHPSLKGYGSNNKQGNMWEPYQPSEAFCKLNKQIQAAVRPIARGSQANLKACIDGDTRLLFVSIYPFERPFLQICPQKPFRFLFKFLLPKKKYDLLGEATLGIPAAEIKRKIEEANSNKGVNYFEEYQEELAYLNAPENAKSTDPAYRDYSFQLVKDYDEYKSLIENPRHVVGILSVEGAHAFGNYAFANPFSKSFGSLSGANQKIIETSILANISLVKANSEEKLIPFFVTFSHHFNNLLAGQSTSLSDKSKLVKVLRTFFNPGMRHLFDQKPNLEQGISTLGKKVIDALLTKETGRRILIDTKHMSVRSRKEFYQILKDKYANDNIPIVHSHGAVSGWKTLDQAILVNSDYRLDEHSFCSRWTINLTDEDIETTFASDGLIGVCLHEGRMPGKKFKDQKKALVKKNDAQGVIDLYMKLLWSNILHIVSVQKAYIDQNNTPENDPWKGITIGSDYDGIVDPFDGFESITSYPELRKSLISHLTEGKDVIHVASESAMGDRFIQTLLDGKSIEEVVEQIFFKNADEFLGRYFTGEYLK